MSEATQLLLQRFKAKKTEKDSTSLQEARRLVNVYRSLSCFGDAFIDKYNDMLLHVEPNVRRLFGTFMGGKEVEDYLEFLEENAHLSVSEKGQNKTVGVSQTKGYLPNPDSDDTATLKKDGTIAITEQEWKEMKAQNAALAKKTQDLLNIVTKLEEKNGSQVSVGRASMTKSSPFERYSEILEDTTGGKSDE